MPSKENLTNNLRIWGKKSQILKPLKVQLLNKNGFDGKRQIGSIFRKLQRTN